MNNIKDYKSKELVYLAISNLLIWSYFNIDNLSTVDISVMSTLLEATIMFGAIQMIVFILDAIYSDKAKNRLIWAKQCLPGEVVFSKVIPEHEDIRIDNEIVKKEYLDIYKNMPSALKDKKKYENREWYKLYNKYEQNSKVYFSQREWLLCRDIYVGYFTSLVCYLLLQVAVDKQNISFEFIGYLLIMLIISNIAARIKSERFVLNVIAVDLANREIGQPV